MENKEPVCLRCGACCILASGRDCKYLMRFKNGLTACKIYSRRKLPLKIIEPGGEIHFCCDRKEIAILGNIFPGCPYNVFAPPGSKYKEELKSSANTSN